KSIALLVGRAEALLGDRTAAMDHYQRSLEWTTKIGFRSEGALTRLAMAELLLYEGKTDEARQHLDFVISEFREMKMQPALERALAQRGQAPGQASIQCHAGHHRRAARDGGHQGSAGPHGPARRRRPGALPEPLPAAGNHAASSRSGPLQDLQPLDGGCLAAG